MITDQERHVIDHSLGYPKRGRKPYRNHFCTGEGSDDWETCQALCARGLMVSRKPSELTGGDTLFIVTDAGKAALKVKP